jgi:multiple sugar transport system substrate-binding protein
MDKEIRHMARTNVATGANPSGTVSRARFLRQAGLGAAGVALGGALPQALNAGRAFAAVSFAKSQLNVTYWGTVTPKHYLLDVFNGFAKKNNLAVKYNPEPQVFGDLVQKFTTYLSSGYSGIDVLWLDEFMTATFSTAGWLVPLEDKIPREAVAAIGKPAVKLSTYNGHLYRLPGTAGAVVFFYRKDVFDKMRLSVPRTWQDIVKVGKQLTKGGRYGIGFAGKNGNTELFNEMCYWMGQAGADPLHLKTSGARTALKFVYDMLNVHKIMPPDTVSADYTSLEAAFVDGRIYMWPVWAGFYQRFITTTNFWKPGKVAVAAPPRGPVNNTTLADSWGWSISKYSKNQDMAAKFIQYVTAPQSEVTIAQTGSPPARVALLNNSRVQKAISYATFLERYNREHLTHPRPITAQAQRISDAFEAVVNRYLNKQIGLDAAINEAQQKIDQIQRLS